VNPSSLRSRDAWISFQRTNLKLRTFDVTFSATSAGPKIVPGRENPRAETSTINQISKDESTSPSPAKLGDGDRARDNRLTNLKSTPFPVELCRGSTSTRNLGRQRLSCKSVAKGCRTFPRGNSFARGRFSSHHWTLDHALKNLDPGVGASLSSDETGITAFIAISPLR